jgi:hypothetical protein
MGWASNRWVRLFAAVLILWAAFDALVSLLTALFPGHQDLTRGIYRQSAVEEFFQNYWSVMYPRDHPNWTRLLALLRYGTTLLVCAVVLVSLRSKPNRPEVSS